MSNNINLEQLVSAFGGSHERRSNGAVRVRCPLCQHRSLWLEQKNGVVVGCCQECYDKGRQPEINSHVKELLKAPARSPLPKPASEKKETLINPPWDKWVPLTEQTYQVVKQARNARKSYMPRLETLRRLGVRETPGKKGAPHAQVGFPLSLGDILPAGTSPAFPTPDDLRPSIDNLKVLTDAQERCWYQAGPKRQDVIFGVADAFMMIDEVWLVEGVWDAACLIEHGFNAWAIQVAGQKELHPGLWAILQQATHIYVMPDNDEGKKVSFAKLLDKLPEVYTRIIQLPKGIKDACSLRHHTTEAGFRSFLAASTQQSIEIRPRRATETQVADLGVKDMPSAVLDGRLGELCEQELLPTLPIAYAWTALITCASTLVPDTGGNQIRTNLFGGLVGDPHSGKNESIERSLTLLGINADDVRFKPGSGEGLAERLSAEEASGSGSAPRHLMYPDELMHLLGKATIDRSSLPWMLCTLYGSDVDKLGTKKDKTNIHARLSVVGGIVTDVFGNAFNADSVGGLYDRFIYGLQPTGFIFDYRPYIRNDFTLPTPGVVTIDHSVWDLKTEWIKSIADPTARSAMGRIVELGLRVAAICAAFARPGSSSSINIECGRSCSQTLEKQIKAA